jgi:DNA helicase-2/ATP-dependent DNA helicase PcrA
MSTEQEIQEVLRGAQRQPELAPRPDGFVPSKYQQDIFDWTLDTDQHGIINAVAGSGKTTTLIRNIPNCLKKRRGKIVAITFTTLAADSFREKIPPQLRTEVEISTFNAFGWRICRDNVTGVKLDRYKDDNLLKGAVDPDLDPGRYYRVRKPLLRMVSLLKALNKTPKDWEEAAREYGVEMGEIKPMDRFEDALNAVFWASVNQLRTMSFGDQIFQPIYRNWAIPPYPWALIDELQDSTPVDVEMARRIARRGRILGVGDPDQSIYLFRGAHPDAMGALVGDLGAAELPLSTCYRCPDAVIESAKKQVPRIEAPVPNPRGAGVVDWITVEEFRAKVKPGDIVLCRTTAPLVKRCLQDIRDGRRAYVKGRDVGEGLIALIERIHGNQQLLAQQYRVRYEHGDELSAQWPSDLEVFLRQTAEYFVEQSERLNRLGYEMELINLDANVETIKVLAEGADYVVEMIRKIEELFDQPDKQSARAADWFAGAIQYMTMHKCKGLEFDTVFLLRLDLCPHPRAKSEKFKAQDRNLLYVAKTRAMKELFFVRKELDER